jgi:hypothetical protein
MRLSSFYFYPFKIYNCIVSVYSSFVHTRFYCSIARRFLFFTPFIIIFHFYPFLKRPKTPKFPFSYPTCHAITSGLYSSFGYNRPVSLIHKISTYTRIHTQTHSLSLFKPKAVKRSLGGSLEPSKQFLELKKQKIWTVLSPNPTALISRRSS